MGEKVDPAPKQDKLPLSLGNTKEASVNAQVGRINSRGEL